MNIRRKRGEAKAARAGHRRLAPRVLAVADDAALGGIHAVAGGGDLAEPGEIARGGEEQRRRIHGQRQRHRVDRSDRVVAEHPQRERVVGFGLQQREWQVGGETPVGGGAAQIVDGPGDPRAFRPFRPNAG